MSVIAQAGAKGRQLHKFGGSSLADVKCYLRVAGIMAEYSMPGDMMVVSAAGSTTNQLISWLKLSQTDRLSAHQVQQTLRRYQSDLISGLLPAQATAPLPRELIERHLVATQVLSAPRGAVLGLLARLRALPALAPVARAIPPRWQARVKDWLQR